MPSNLRSRPIEGHITDSAGNIIRNAEITIRMQTPNGSFVVDAPTSDESGYFISAPLPFGEYDIYESGILVSHISHSFNIPKIQCYKASAENYSASIVGDFNSLANSGTLNKFKMFIQIESDRLDIARYGSTFPIYNYNIAGLVDSNNELFNMAKFLEMVSDVSKITTTRFDVEYNVPLTEINNSYVRVRWAGVPAIRYDSESKLLIPLDYFSIVASLPKLFSPNTEANYANGDIISSFSGTSGLSLSATNANASFVAMYNAIVVGDIVKTIFYDGTSNKIWYGIITSKLATINGSTTTYQLVLEKWKSSRFLSETTSLQNYYVKQIEAFDGMSQSMLLINQDVNEFFTVVENTSAQNGGGELYNYNNRYTS